MSRIRRQKTLRAEFFQTLPDPSRLFQSLPDSAILFLIISDCEVYDFGSHQERRAARRGRGGRGGCPARRRVGWTLLKCSFCPHNLLDYSRFFETRFGSGLRVSPRATRGTAGSRRSRRIRREKAILIVGATSSSSLLVVIPVCSVQCDCLVCNVSVKCLEVVWREKAILIVGATSSSSSLGCNPVLTLQCECQVFISRVQSLNC